MRHSAIIGVAGHLQLQRSPFLPEATTTPHVPRRIVERPPVNVTLVIKIERSNPVHLVGNQKESREDKSRT